MRRLAASLVALLAVAGPAAGDEVAVCFNYGCKSQAVVRIDTQASAHVSRIFAQATSAQSEREAIAYATAWMYFLAGQQTPTWRDRGGNLDDDGVEGAMDCIDHSTNTTTWLQLFARRGWLKFHDVGERIMRGRLLSVHWGARIVERETRNEWIVDSWFLDPGNPAAIYPLKVWLDGARPPGTEIWRWNLF